MSQTLDRIKESLQQQGWTAATRPLLHELCRSERFWLLKRKLEPGSLPTCGAGDVRMADPVNLDRIVAAWPDEFGGSIRREAARRRIKRRFESGYPCLISERGGQIEGAVWCLPWEFDERLGSATGREDAFEVCDLFVIASCRGKGVGLRLLIESLALMMARGKGTAYSRVPAQGRTSTVLCRRFGFRRLGVMHSTILFGRQRHRLIPLTTARRADLRGLPMPPCIVLAQSAWGGALEAIRSLGSRGVPVYVFTLGREPTPYARSRYCRAARRLDSPDAASMARELMDWCKEQRFCQKPVLLPFTDVAATFVAESRAVLEGCFTVGSPSPESVYGVMDKEQAHSQAIACGLDVPHTTVVRTPTELRIAAEAGKYPAIVKPIWWRSKGAGDFKTATFDTPEALIAGMIPRLAGGASVLVQEYIQGPDGNVETFLFYRDRRGTIWGCTSRKLRQSPPNAGIMAAGHAVEIPQVRQLCEAFLKQIDYRGLGGIEFKRSGHRRLYIETNPRLGAFHALARKAGLDLVWIAYCDYCLGDLAEEPSNQREAFYLNWAAFRASYGWGHVLPWMGHVLRMLAKRPLKIAVFEWTDPGPSACLIWRSIRAKWGQILGKEYSGRLQQL